MNVRGRPIIARRAAGRGADPETTREGSGDRLDGTIVQVADGEVVLTLANGARGVAGSEEFTTPPTIGERVGVTYLARDARHGEILCTPREPLNRVDWDTLEKGMLVTGRVTTMSRDGIRVDIAGQRAFLPLSQLSRDGDVLPDEFRRRSVAAEVVAVNKKTKEIRLGLRERFRRRDQRLKDRILGSLEAGQQVTGQVARRNEHGAFVDLGGVDGLLHESKILRHRQETDSPADVQVGQEVSLVILNVDPDRGRVALGFPREDVTPRSSESLSDYEIDETVTGMVREVSDEGCSVLVDENIRFWLPSECFARADVDIRRGKVVSARIASIDPRARRIELTL